MFGGVGGGGHVLELIGGAESADCAGVEGDVAERGAVVGVF